MRKTAEYLTAAACFLTVLCIVACADGKKPAHDQAAYKTLVVGKKDMKLEHQYTARLTGRQIVEIRPQVSGTITRICINEGETVRKGEVLFVIDQTPFRSALDAAVAARKSAEARLATARMNFENETLLKEGNVVSEVSVRTMQNALAEAEAALNNAKAQETAARHNLSYTEVTSPVSGVASMIPWHVGSLVGPTITEPLITVADDSEVYAYFSINHARVLDLISRYGSVDEFVKEAPEVGLRLINGEEYAQKGRITAMSGTIDEQTGAVQLRATFSNPQRLLRSGGAATIVLPSDHRDCIVIPQEATYELQNRVFVYRVVSGRTKATAISLFPQNNGHEYIVESGLSEGDTIIAEGAGLLKDGIDMKSEQQKAKGR